MPFSFFRFGERWPRVLPSPVVAAVPVAAIALLAVPVDLGAQESGRSDRTEAPPMVTDRPDRTESAATVAPGRIQLEGGWSLSSIDSGSGDVRDHAFGEALARIGLLDFLEARVGFGGFRSVDRDEKLPGEEDAGEPDGAADLSLGLKARLRRAGSKAGPDVALLAGTTLPSGEAPFSSERADPEVRLAVDQELGAGVSVGVNTGFAWESQEVRPGDRERLADALYTVAFGYGVTDRLGAFVESFGFLPISDESAGRHSLDGGLTYGLRPNLQLDVSAGLGLDDDAEDWFVGAGISIRAPR